MSSKKGFVYAVATADTKASQLIYLKEMVAQTGVAVVTVDLSVQRVNHGVQTDFTAGQVAAYHPQGADRVFCRERGEAIKAMALAFTLFLCQRDDVAGVIGLGGSGGTALITPAMQALAVGIPKLMVSSMASGQVSGYVGTSDIAMLYPVTDMSGLNRISRRVLANAARQIAGAVCFASEEQAEETPALGLTMFGVTTPCVEAVSRRLEADFECLVFHATGCGGRAMEKLADDRMLDGILDLTTTEVADLLFGGVLACGADRFDALARTRLPCVLSCGALDMINFREPHSIPEKFAGRQFCSHNAWVTLMRTTPQENVQMARWIADKLNRCEGEIRFLIPEGGFSALDAEGQPFWCPAADRAFIRSLEQHLVKSARRQVIRLPWHINDPRFADEAAKQFRQLVANRPAGRQAQ